MFVGVTHIHAHRTADMEHVAKLDEAQVLTSPRGGVAHTAYVIRARDSVNVNIRLVARGAAAPYFFAAGAT